MIPIREALAGGTQAIQAHRVSQTPLLDASLLLCAVTGCSREQLYSRSDTNLTTEQAEQFQQLVSKRCRCVPIAYLIGKRDFYGRTFTVNPSVLIPRPDTETLVEVSLGILNSLPEPEVLDLCTGSGCIGITLAAEVPHAQVTLSDISSEALVVAQKNAKIVLDRPIEILASDLFDSLIGRKFHLIVTNPPYLTDSWYDEVELQVKVEPALALLGGDDDGLAIIRQIIAEAPDHLHPGGAVCIECDYRQAERIAELLSQQGFTEVGIRSDLAQHQRVVWGFINV